MRTKIGRIAVVVWLVAACSAALADTLTPSRELIVIFDFETFNRALATSVNAGVNPPNLFYRGFAEFDISGVGQVNQATLTFSRIASAELLPTGHITVDTYAVIADEDPQFPTGRNRLPFFAPSLSQLGSIPIGGPTAGEQITLDVTAALDQAVAEGVNELGIRFTALFDDPTRGGIAGFDKFMIETAPLAPVPEPSTWALMIAGVVVATKLRRNSM